MHKLLTEEGEEFLMLDSGKWLPICDEEFDKLLSLSTDWGVKTSEEEIDPYLYGKPKSLTKHK